MVPLALKSREMSARLLEEKMSDIAATGATTIATANPGCMLQLETGLRQRGMDGSVVHVIELLDEAMRVADQPSAQRSNGYRRQAMAEKPHAGTDEQTST